MNRQQRQPHSSPTETPAVAGFQQYARFERIDHTQNCERFYLLSWQPLLWGELALVRCWGRVGTEGQRRLEATYPDRESAQPLVTRLVRRRLKRRYELTDWV